MRTYTIITKESKNTHWKEEGDPFVCYFTKGYPKERLNLTDHPETVSCIVCLGHLQKKGVLPEVVPNG